MSFDQAIRTLLGTFVLLGCAAGTAWSQTGSHSGSGFQTGRVVGEVYDSETREPLVGGMVMIEGTNLGNVTMENGSYFVDHVPTGSYTISAEYLGYGTIRRPLDVSAGQTVDVDFALPSQVVLANAITAVIEKEPIPVEPPVKDYKITSEVQVNVPNALPEESCRAMVTVHGSYIVNGEWALAASVGRLVCGNQEIVCQPIVVYKDLDQNAPAEEPPPAEEPGKGGVDAAEESKPTAEPTAQTAALE
ncbi:MAG: carboxypeptidase-like regulatory domain-containing protein [Gemmatimonadota bacterium]